MPHAQSLTKTRVTGEILQIKYSDPADGFCVVTLLTADDRKIAAKGTIPGASEGQTVEADGYFEQHPAFGMQFRIESCRTVLPSTAAGIERFLRYSVPGIGPKTAAAIVKCFGRETIQVLDLYPKRLQEVPKIGAGKAEKILAVWKNTKQQREETIFLQGLGVTPAYCARLFQRYGEKTVAMVRQNPYRLAEEVNGIGFLKADAIARELGFREDSVERHTAAAVFQLNTLAGEGHVCAPREELLKRTVELCGQSPEIAEKGIAAALERRLLYEDRGHIYTPYLLLAESRLPGIIAALASSKKFSGRKLAHVAALPHLTLDEKQSAAVDSVWQHALNIITGGPGVGKTTVIGEIVRRAKSAGIRIALAAPTGRAAKRMSESSGLEAKTIHRLLLFDPATAKFVYNKDRRLECDMLIVDEVSMLDLILAYQLFQALPADCSVVLVGDADQLPSVGPGKILHDLMASGFFGVTKLTRIFRQSSGSRIVLNAHRVNGGKMPEKPSYPPGETGDFYWIEQDDPDRAAEMISTMVCERIPKRFGFDPMSQIQVLCPMNRGNCGTVALNERLAEALNGSGDPPSFTFGSRVFRFGDKVMQISNNYDKNVFNGDLGHIVKLESHAKKFIVEFDGGNFVTYRFDEADQLNPAYAVTIHKSQGCEFPAVVMPLLTQHYVMLQRNLLYTGMTRAKKLLILIGSAKAVELAVRNIRQRPRCSLLSERLAEILPDRPVQKQV